MPVGGFRFGDRYIVTFLQLPVNNRPGRDFRMRHDCGRRQEGLPMTGMLDLRDGEYRSIAI